MSYYLRGDGGSNALPNRFANVCAAGVEQSIEGDCTGSISGLPVYWKSAPGTRQQWTPGPWVLKPYQFWVPELECPQGYSPMIAGWQPSCRPSSKAAPSGCGYSANNKQYSYTF